MIYRDKNNFLNASDSFRALKKTLHLAGFVLYFRNEHYFTFKWNGYYFQ